MKIKYYHTSGTRFRPGDILGGPGRVVCLNTSPIVHSTIWDAIVSGYPSWKAYKEDFYPKVEKYWDDRMKWNETQEGDKPEYPIAKNDKAHSIWVYEVKPFDKPTFNGMNDEYRSYGFVEVVKVIGSGVGILQNHFKKFGKNSRKSYHFGGKALRLYKK